MNALRKAEEHLRDIVRLVDGMVYQVSYTENGDERGTLRMTAIDATHGRYHPDSEEWDSVANNPAVQAALRELTAAGAGTDSLRIMRHFP